MKENRTEAKRRWGAHWQSLAERELENSPVTKNEKNPVPDP